jgi:hypothetical protein
VRETETEREREKDFGQYFNGKVEVEWELMGNESTFTSGVESLVVF